MRRIAGLMVAVALLAASCAGQSRLDRARVEADIKAQLLPGYPGQITSVTCPEMDEPELGQSFTCAAILGGQLIDVAVTLGGSEDELTSTATTQARFVAVNEIAALLGATFGDELGIPTSVDCGQPVIVLPPGETVQCAATDPRGAIRSFDVAIDDQGVLQLSLR